MQPVPPPATACGRDARRPRRGALEAADAAAAAAGLAPRRLPGRAGPGQRAAAERSGHGACSRLLGPGAPPPPAASARWVRGARGAGEAGRGAADTRDGHPHSSYCWGLSLPRGRELSTGALQPLPTLGFPDWAGQSCLWSGQSGAPFSLSSPQVRLLGGAVHGRRRGRGEREKTVSGTVGRGRGELEGPYSPQTC